MLSKYKKISSYFNDNVFSYGKLIKLMTLHGLPACLLGAIIEWHIALTCGVVTAILGGIAYCDRFDD